MTRLFIDTDIILDVLLKRTHYPAAAAVLSRIEKRECDGYTTPVVFANIHYIVTRQAGKRKSLQNLRKLRKIISILPIDEETIDEALLSDAGDFEDAIQYVTAKKHRIDFIVTRNKTDYEVSAVPALTAEEFLEVEKTRQRQTGR